MAACTTLGNFPKFGTIENPFIVDTTCEAFGKGDEALLPFFYSKRDTPETKTRARAVNRVYDTLCPPKETPK